MINSNISLIEHIEIYEGSRKAYAHIKGGQRVPMTYTSAELCFKYLYDQSAKMIKQEKYGYTNRDVCEVFGQKITVKKYYKETNYQWQEF